MIDFQGVLVVLGSTMDKMTKVKWFRVIPRFKIFKYPYLPNDDEMFWAWTLGVEFTAPWKREGLGIAIGLGTVDLWFGWPRSEELLHHAGCLHDKSLELADS